MQPRRIALDGGQRAIAKAEGTIGLNQTCGIEPRLTRGMPPAPVERPDHHFELQPFRHGRFHRRRRHDHAVIAADGKGALEAAKAELFEIAIEPEGDGKATGGQNIGLAEIDWLWQEPVIGSADDLAVFEEKELVHAIGQEGDATLLGGIFGRTGIGGEFLIHDVEGREHIGAHARISLHDPRRLRIHADMQFAEDEPGAARKQRDEAHDPDDRLHLALMLCRNEKRYNSVHQRPRLPGMIDKTSQGRVNPIAWDCRWNGTVVAAPAFFPQGFEPMQWRQKWLSVLEMH